MCARAVLEVETSRDLVKSLEARLDTARKEIAAAEAKDALEARERELLTQNVANLEDAVKLARDGLKRAEDDLARVRGERDKARGRLKYAAIFGAVGGAVLTALALGAANN